MENQVSLKKLLVGAIIGVMAILGLVLAKAANAAEPPATPTWSAIALNKGECAVVLMPPESGISPTTASVRFTRSGNTLTATLSKGKKVIATWKFNEPLKLDGGATCDVKNVRKAQVAAYSLTDTPITVDVE